MGDETEREQPSLELPKLGLRRRKRPQASGGSPTESATRPVDRPPPTPLSGGSPTESAPRSVDRPSLRSEPTAVLAPVDPEPELEPGPEPESEPGPTIEAEPARRRQRQIRVRPHRPGGMLATVVTGLVVGLGIVGLTWASLQGCEQVQGTTSCGQTGYLLLIAILVVMVVVGTMLLRLARVAEAGATSFLAVGLASVLALLLLVDHLTDPSMVVVIPLLSAACYAAAHWVTRTFVDAA